ncbi:reprolysin-like metallopeptidase [Flavobacterium sp. AG291]|uniref:zinc-dependent metalloprotease n=1 Tax=Flavobacterium sp. AG291 TaxID=2184000 RepID=UPI000E0BDD44|nr:zinc-dependent metalloprotease family protein [Flavobacterium sp. AG291]RDI10327.1 putative secreted protein (Por secretion system target) [Flavobacterium sp. AG291]
MKKRLLIVMASVVFMSGAYAQNALWNRTEGKNISPTELSDRASVPSEYHLYQLNLPLLKSQLANAPMRGGKVASGVIIQFPDGNGELKSFKMFEAPVMQPGLAAKYPDMKSYVGQGIDNPAEVIRLSVTRYGLHTMLSTNEGTAYTDPYTKDGLTSISYKRASVEPRTFYCGVTETTSKKKTKNLETMPFSVTATDGQLRTYRLAMACTIEYAAFHIQAAALTGGTIAQQTEAVLAAMVVTVTRVNSVYEKDFAVTLQLIDDNDQLIFITSDNFDNNNTNNALLNQSQGVIDGAVGFDSYDIGHVVSTGGGGVAQLWSPCSNSKARGITGLPAPVGDPYDIDFVAHEMGHQFGGNHTFNNECDGNVNESTAYETGSGSTIMGYAGVCFPSVQDHSDAYFHRISIEEITDFIKGWGDCSVNIETGNAAPVVDAGLNYTIPKSTPFILKATGTDADNDALTYSWEQMDLEMTVQPPVSTSTEGPNFRSIAPQNSPERYMPALNSVLSNNLYPTWEVISDVARTYNFMVTARDNNVEGGQTAYDDTQITVSGVAGPFLVTSPNTNVSWQAGSNQTVTWNVAGTTANGINAEYVDILMSNNGGQTYPVVLAAKVPNDGSEIITVPVGNGTNKRIMVRGYNHIFYDLSNTNFAVTSASSTMAISVNGEQNKPACKGSEVTFELSYQALSGFSDATTFTVTGNPEGSTVSFSPDSITASGNVTVTVTVPQSVVPGLYSMTVTATSGSVTKAASLYLDVINTNFDSVVLTSPANNAVDVVSNVQLEWAAVAGATSYQLEVATDAEFETVVANESLTATSYTIALNSESTYFWRVQPLSATCSGTTSEAFSFTTSAAICSNFAPVNATVVLPDAGTATSTLSATGTGDIAKVTVGLKINHTRVNDLTVKLTSPEGTQVTLFQNVCVGDFDNVDATFDDNGDALVCGTNPVVSGFITPLQTLSAFNGQSPEGTWTLTVNDDVVFEGGELVSWSLNICSVEEPPVTGLNENALAGLTVTPNPNKGDFMVRFNSLTGNDVKIAVYDIRGRQLFANAYAYTGLIEQSVSLNNAAAGIYLVSIQDGDSTVTKKIIIE